MNKLYAWSIVGISWIIESAGNTAFLMVNDDYGLLGGFVTAVVVAAINIILSALVGQYWWPYLFYRKPAQRLLAASGSILWFLAVIVWNLLVGHFRDAKILGLANPEQAALGLFLNRPFQLDSIYSYGLLVLGIVFAVLAATAAFRKDDPYPGYGAIYRRHEDRCDEYADQIEEALDELRGTRDDAIETANAIRSELGAQFRERGQIISSRDTHRNRYREHQDYLETIGNALLGQYRAANVRSRTDKLSPSHFNKPWVLKRTDLPLDTAEPSIDNEVLRAQEVLEHSIKTISQAYQEAIESFEHLERSKDRSQMARKSTASQKRKQADTAAAVRNIAIVVGLLTVIGIFWFRSVLSHRPLDSETMCPTQLTSVTVLLVDVTDPMNLAQRQDFANQLDRLVDEIPRYGKLVIAKVDPVSDRLLAPVITRCNPGSASDTSDINGNPQRLEKLHQENSWRR